MKKQTLILCMALLVSTFAMSQPGQGRGQRQQNPDNRMDKIAERLELTPEQQTKFEASIVAHHKNVQPLQNELNEKRAALKSLTTAEAIDQKKIDKVIDEIGVLETKLLKAKTNQQIAIRSILTDKQKMLFDQHQMHKQHAKGDHMKKPQRG